MALIHVTAETFEKQVLESKTPVLADFWATWCGPCQMLAPVLEEIAAERPDVTVAKINVDEDPSLAARFGIDAIPAVLLFRDGKVAGTSVGYCGKEKLLALL